MEITNNIKKIIQKEGIPLKELLDIVLAAIVVVDDNSWKIIIDQLLFPVELNNDELFELIEFYFINEYDGVGYINMYYAPNEIFIDGDKNYGIFWLALILVFSIAIIAIIVMRLQ